MNTDADIPPIGVIRGFFSLRLKQV